jgi:hypothetical protein
MFFYPCNGVVDPDSQQPLVAPRSFEKPVIAGQKNISPMRLCRGNMQGVRRLDAILLQLLGPMKQHVIQWKYIRFGRQHRKNAISPLNIRDRVDFNKVTVYRPA